MVLSHRVRIWGGFLVWAVSAWVLLWIPAKETQPGSCIVHSVTLTVNGELHLAMQWRSRGRRTSPDFRPAVAYLYFFILLISVLHLFFESRRLKSALQRTLPPSPQLQTCFERLCNELHVGRCELRLAPDLRSPATCYWWRSHVLLPWNWSLISIAISLKMFCGTNFSTSDNMTICGIDWQRFGSGGFLSSPGVVSLSASAMGARVGLRLCGRKGIQRGAPAVCRVSYQPRPLVHGKKNVFARNNFLFFRIPAKSQSSGRSQRTLDLLSFSKSCSCGTCLHSYCCFFVAAGSGTISVYTDSPDQLFCSIWQSPSSSSRKKGAEGKAAHSYTPKALSMKTVQMTPQSGAESIKSLLDIPPTSLPLLSPSTAGDDAAATQSASSKGMSNREADTLSGTKLPCHSRAPRNGTHLRLAPSPEP